MTAANEYRDKTTDKNQGSLTGTLRIACRTVDKQTLPTRNHRMGLDNRQRFWTICRVTLLVGSCARRWKKVMSPTLENGAQSFWP